MRFKRSSPLIAAPSRFSTAGRRFRCDSGMTILELLVVIAILGVLATLGSIQVLGYLGRAKADAARLQLRELVVAVDLFQMDLGRAPTSAEGLDALLTRPPDGAGWRGPYLRNRAILADPWGTPYQYDGDFEGGGYELLSLGADRKPGGSNDAADLSNRELD